MNYELLFSRQAQRDLRSIVRYLASRFGLPAALTFRHKLVSECESLRIAPHRGTLKPELGATTRRIGVDGRTTITFETDEIRRLVVILRVQHRGRMF